MKHIVAASLLLSLETIVALSGCASDSADPKNSNAPSPSATNGEHDHADQDASGQSEMDKMKAELAKLSPEDAKSAEKQHTCPVSGHMLGKMGAPKKIDVNGQQVWICCDACEDQLLENPGHTNELRGRGIERRVVALEKKGRSNHEKWPSRRP